MKTITFHTGDEMLAKMHFVKQDRAGMIIIDSNQPEGQIVNDTFNALNDDNCWSEINIFSHSELAFTAVRNWCFHNEISAEIWNWSFDKHEPFISIIDTDGRIENWGDLFQKRNELLMELM